MAPETEKPAPLIVAELIVTAEVPVEDRVTDCVVAVFTGSLPKLMLDELTLSVETDAFNCNANVCDVLPALAVRVTAWAVLTAVTVAEKLALVAPAATVTDPGTVTAELLLERLTANPPVDAAEFSETVHESVPAPVMEELVQETPVSTGVPVPLRLTVVEAPAEELLASTSVPLAAPAVLGLNWIVSVAV